MKGVIDIHAHVLPGVDDGARDLQETLFLLEMAVSQGIMAVIATSHNTGRMAPGRLIELTAQIEKEMRKKYPKFRLYPGQEIYFHEEIVEHLKKGELLTLANSQCVMIEFNTEIDYKSLYRGVRILLSAGYRPVLAHMERYRCLQKEAHLADLMDSGCLLQMNYGSLQGSSLSRKVRWCREQVLSGRIHFLGTDMHQREHRPPKIGGALKWLENHAEEELYDRMTWRNALRIIRKEVPQRR